MSDASPFSDDEPDALTGWPLPLYTFVPPITEAAARGYPYRGLIGINSEQGASETGAAGGDGTGGPSVAGLLLGVSWR